MLIGITGSISSGKTTAAKMFGMLGARVIDCDALVHELYRKNDGLKKKISVLFGKEIIKRGGIDRKGLAGKVLKKKDEIDRLNRIVHPVVIGEIERIALRAKKGIIVIDAPLLIESGLHRDMDCVIVVRTALKRSLERAKKDGKKRDDILKKHRQQLPAKKKRRLADYIIDNNGTKRKTARSVMRIWKELTAGSGDLRRSSIRKKRKTTSE